MEKKISTELYYFTGTGNSLHIAKELQARLPDTVLIPIIKQLNKEIIKTNADKVGFVFPIHLTTLPIPVKIFLEKVDIRSANYLFAVATRRNSFFLADVHISQILKRKGKPLASFFILNMIRNSPCGLVPNWFPGFNKMTSQWADEISGGEIEKLESVVQDKLEKICNKILDNDSFLDEGTSLKRLFKIFISPILSLGDSSRKTIPFYADCDCTGCAICEQICPSNRIKIVNEKPVWQKDIPCYFCYACFNSCPVSAILVKDRYTLKNGRYLHPSISTEEIIEQKTRF